MADDDHDTVDYRVPRTEMRSTSSSRSRWRPRWTEAQLPGWWPEPSSVDRCTAVARSPDQWRLSASEAATPPAGRPGAHASESSIQRHPCHCRRALTTTRWPRRRCSWTSSWNCSPPSTLLRNITWCQSSHSTNEQSLQYRCISRTVYQCH